MRGAEKRKSLDSSEGRGPPKVSGSGANRRRAGLQGKRRRRFEGKKGLGGKGRERTSRASTASGEGVAPTGRKGTISAVAAPYSSCEQDNLRKDISINGGATKGADQ